ncbi:MAG: hypothetical protein QXX77_07825 [Candidatus Methanosuratincola sp.]
MKNAILLLLVLPLMVAACAREERVQKEEKAHEEAKEAREPVAIVGGKKIYSEDIGEGDLNQAIQDELLYQIGVESGIDKAIATRVEEYKRSAIIDAMTNKLISEIHPEVTDEEVHDYYNTHQSDYTTVELIEAEFPTIEMARLFAERVNETKDVKRAIREFEESKGASIVTKPNKRVVELFGSAIEVGTASPIAEIDGRFGLTVVAAKRPSTIDDVYDIIYEKLQVMEIEDAFRRKIEELKRQKDVKILKPAQ